MAGDIDRVASHRPTCGAEYRAASDVGPLVVSPVNLLEEVLMPRSQIREARRVPAEVESGEDRI